MKQSSCPPRQKRPWNRRTVPYKPLPTRSRGRLTARNGDVLSAEAPEVAVIEGEVSESAEQEPEPQPAELEAEALVEAVSGRARSSTPRSLGRPQKAERQQEATRKRLATIARLKEERRNEKREAEASQKKGKHGSHYFTFSDIIRFSKVEATRSSDLTNLAAATKSLIKEIHKTDKMLVRLRMDITNKFEQTNVRDMEGYAHRDEDDMWRPRHDISKTLAKKPGFNDQHDQRPARERFRRRRSQRITEQLMDGTRGQLPNTAVPKPKVGPQCCAVPQQLHEPSA
jgi:hypothetical protein